MKIHKFLPSGILQPFVREFLIIEADHDTITNALPDTTVVLSFQLKGRVTQLLQGQKEKLPFNAIAGLRKTARQFYYDAGTVNLLVLLNEGGMAAFSSIPVWQLFGQTIATGHIFEATELDQLTEKFAEANTPKDCITIIELFLSSKLSFYKKDLAVLHAANLIRQQNGIIKIKDLVQSQHISLDAFEKRFRALIGASPKQYASVVRLRSVTQNVTQYTSLTNLAFESGYFDQSHFIRDFKLFTGQAPKDFFSSVRYW